MSKVIFFEEEKPEILFNTYKSLRIINELAERRIIFEWDDEEDGILIIKKRNISWGLDYVHVYIKIGEIRVSDAIPVKQ